MANSDFKKVKVNAKDLPPVSTGNKRIFRYRIVSESGEPLSDWSSKYTVTGESLATVSVSLTAAYDAGATSLFAPSFLSAWEDEKQRPGYDVFVSYGIAVTSWSRSTTTMTLTLAASHNFKVNDLVDVYIKSETGFTISNTAVTAVTSDTVSYTVPNSGNSSGNSSTKPGAISFTDTSSSGYDPLNDYAYVYHGTTSTHQYAFIAYPYASAKVLVQVEGNSKKLDTATKIGLSDRKYGFLT